MASGVRPNRIYFALRHLQWEGSSTRLNYSANASIGGKLAQIGSRLVDGVAQKMAADFLVKFSMVTGGSSGAVPTTQASTAELYKKLFNPIWIVVGGAIAVTLIIWWVMGEPR